MLFPSEPSLQPGIRLFCVSFVVNTDRGSYLRPVGCVKNNEMEWRIGSSMKYLPGMHEDLSSIHRAYIKKLDVVACNPVLGDGGGRSIRLSG